MIFFPIPLDVKSLIDIHCASSSHVNKTGDIKGFVITEESGIAKGIRRITAVTGHEAADVTRQAKTLTATLDKIEKATGKEKDAMLKTLQIVCLFSPVNGILVLTDPRRN